MRKFKWKMVLPVCFLLIAAGCSAQLEPEAQEQFGGRHVTPMLAAGALKVQSFQSGAVIQNQIYQKIKLVNTSASSLPLSGVKLRYYFKYQGSTSYQFACDWTSVGSANIGCSFKAVNPAQAGAEAFEEVTFTAAAGSIAAGSSIELQLRIWKSDWSNIDNSQNYSYNPAAGYSDWSKITASINTELAWGVEPGTTAGSSSKTVSSAVSSKAASSVQTAQSPYQGKAQLLPGTIQASFYDVGGEGVATHDTTSSHYGDSTFRGNEAVDGSIDYIGWIDTGEWLEYTVNCTAGTYVLKATTASPSGGTFHISLDGALLAQVSVQATGSYGTYKTYMVGTVSIPSGTHILRITQDSAGFNIASVEMVPGIGWNAQIPTEVTWGAYRNNPQLTASPDSWDFVNRYSDGFLFHCAYWTQETLFPEMKNTALALSPILKKYSKKLIAEIGWPGSYPQFTVNDTLGTRKGNENLNTLNKLKSYGFAIDEINNDWHMYLWKAMCLYYYTMTSAQIEDKAAQFYKDYAAVIWNSYPNVVIRPIDSPVWFTWDSYPSLGDKNNYQRFWPLTKTDGTPFTVNGQSFYFDFNWRTIMNACINKIADARFDGFASDTPYSYTVWGGANSAAAIQYRQKIRTYEAYFHSIKKKHHYTANSDANGPESDKAGWDKNYSLNSLQSMRTHQQEGGRPDSFLFESWYDGPYTMVPETQAYTMTWMVKQAILYIKGIGEKLDLDLQEAGSSDWIGPGVYQSWFGKPQLADKTLTANQTVTYKLTLGNKGTVACMPLIKEVEYGTAGYSVSVTDNGTSVLSDMHSAEGYVLKGLLQPGETRNLVVTITRTTAASGTQRTFAFYAAWNPQDPTAQIRDVVNITLKAQ